MSDDGELLALVDERIEELVSNGQLPPGALDANAETALRQADPHVALKALEEWEKSDLSSRRNPSAFMVSLLRRFEQDRDGAAIPTASEEEDASQRLAELLEEATRLDRNAATALQGISPSKAVYIVEDLLRQGTAVRKPSAFVMSAVRRAEAQGLGSDASAGHGSGSRSATNNLAGVHESIDRLLAGLNLEPEAREALSSLHAEMQVEILKELVRSYNEVRNQSGFVLSRVRRARQGKGMGSHRSPPRRSPPRRSSPRRSPRRSPARNDPVNDIAFQAATASWWDVLDEKAQKALSDLNANQVTEIMQELESKGDGVRNPSAFVCAYAKKAVGRQSYSAVPGPQNGEPSRARSPLRSRSPRGGQEWTSSEAESSGRAMVAAFLKKLHMIDQRAKSALLELQPKDAVDIMQATLAKGSSIRNPSAFVFKMAQKKADAGHELNGRRPRGVAVREDALAQEGDYEVGREELWDQKEERELEDDAQAASMVPDGSSDTSWQIGTSILPEDNVEQSAQAYDDLELPAAAPLEYDHDEQHLESSMGSLVDSTGHSPEAVPSASPGVQWPKAQGWRRLSLSDWIHSVDNNKGFLLQYEEALLGNYDTLEQVMELYVPEPSHDGSLRIDPAFFEDLGVAKLGHRRLFEKWFKDRMV